MFLFNNQTKIISWDNVILYFFNTTVHQLFTNSNPLHITEVHVHATISSKLIQSSQNQFFGHTFKPAIYSNSHASNLWHETKFHYINCKKEMVSVIKKTSYNSSKIQIVKFLS